MVQDFISTANINPVGLETQLIERIRSIFVGNQQINHFVEDIVVSVDKNSIVINGNLPSAELKQQLVPAIRQAGILWQVCNQVQVPVLATDN